MRAFFVPAIPSTFDLKPLTKIGSGGNFRLNWWSPDSAFFYPHALISFAYGQEYHNYRDFLKIGKKTTLWGDSGGFQLVTRPESVTLDPISVLRWQERNCDVAFTLDYPPVRLAGPLHVKEAMKGEKFEKRKKKSIENALLAYERKKNEDLKLYTPIHGQTLSEMDDWFKSTVKEAEFDGYCFGVKPPDNPIRWAITGAYILENIDKPVHFLGASGLKSQLISHYLSRFRINQISYDTSSHSYSLICRRFELIGLFQTGAFVLREGDIDRIRDSMETQDKKWLTCSIENLRNLPCICPVCSNWNPAVLRDKTIGYTEKNMPIVLHNLWVILYRQKVYDALISDPPLFKAFVKRFDAKTWLGIKFIDEAMDIGLEKALSKLERGGLREERGFKRQEIEAKIKTLGEW